MNGIARVRIEEGKTHLQRGDIELAVHEFEGAREVAAEATLREEAQSLIDGIEAEEAVEQAVSHDMTDEERLALIVGQWEDAQANEYDQYGDAVIDALVLVHRGEFEEGCAALEGLLAEAESPRFLWLEVGRARMLTEDLNGAKGAFQQFIDAPTEDEGGENLLAAHLALARMAEEEEDFEGAMPHFEGAVHAMPEDYRPYLAMGGFMRAFGHAAEALEVLDTSLALCTAKTQADWRLLQELGLAHAQSNNPEKATEYLQQVVEFFTSHQVTDFPVLAATKLAELYEKADHPERAADLYRALSEGSDRDNHAQYHFEAGRLLQKVGLQEEAHRMLTRAKALAAVDDALTAQIDALLSAG